MNGDFKKKKRSEDSGRVFVHVLLISICIHVKSAASSCCVAVFLQLPRMRIFLKCDSSYKTGIRKPRISIPKRNFSVR